MPSGPAQRYDFFLSCRGSVAAVATEVTDVLKDNGYRVIVEDYDFRPGASFVEAMHEGIKNSRDLSSYTPMTRLPGDLTGATPLLKRALAIREKVHGPEDPVTADSRVISACYSRPRTTSRGKAALGTRASDPREGACTTSLGCSTPRATLPAQAALGTRASNPWKMLVPEHPDTTRSLNNFAQLLQAQGDLAGARPLLERALAIREKVLGPEHPDTAASLHNLALLLHAQGDFVGARPRKQE